MDLLWIEPHRAFRDLEGACRRWTRRPGDERRGLASLRIGRWQVRLLREELERRRAVEGPRERRRGNRVAGSSPSLMGLLGARERRDLLRRHTGQLATRSPVLLLWHESVLGCHDSGREANRA